ncbi:acyl carrier protein [Streptomyces sp. NPDC093544]|uniref:acyl carrier protein n=1 Tax=Streptomyces sp. NPDC093544 TaxID=3155200 RepID=UPI00343C11A5
MLRDQFYEKFIALLQEVKPFEGPDPQPTSRLWEEGYVDSLTLLDIVTFLEDLVGREVDLTGDAITNFYTMKAMYDGYLLTEPAVG